MLSQPFRFVVVGAARPNASGGRVACRASRKRYAVPRYDRRQRQRRYSRSRWLDQIEAVPPWKTKASQPKGITTATTSRHPRPHACAFIGTPARLSRPRARAHALRFGHGVGKGPRCHGAWHGRAGSLDTPTRAPAAASRARRARSCRLDSPQAERAARFRRPRGRDPHRATGRPGARTAPSSTDGRHHDESRSPPWKNCRANLIPESNFQKDRVLPRCWSKRAWSASCRTGHSSASPPAFPHPFCGDLPNSGNALEGLPSGACSRGTIGGVSPARVLGGPSAHHRRARRAGTLHVSQACIQKRNGGRDP